MGAGSPHRVANNTRGTGTTPCAPSATARQLTAVSAPAVAASWTFGHGLVMLGPPGAGKGTQAQRLTAALDLTVISTGELLRSSVANRTPLGRSAEAYMNRGDLVPDDLVTQMVIDRLGDHDVAPGFLLDGFPRTVAQAEKLDAWLDVRSAQLGAALSFEITEEELLRRLAARAMEQQRRDDTVETVRHRLQVFARSTQPLLRHYAQQGLLVSVDALGSPDDVFERLLGGLSSVTTHNRVARRARSRALPES